MERILSFALWLAAMAAGVQACDWTGSFSSSFGPLLFQQQGDVLIGDDVAQHGVFAGSVNACDLEGVFLNERSGQFGPVIFRLDTTGAPGAGKRRL